MSSLKNNMNGLTKLAVALILLMVFAVSTVLAETSYTQSFAPTDGWVADSEKNSKTFTVDTTGKVPSDAKVTRVHVKADLFARTPSTLLGAASRFDMDNYPTDGVVFFRKGDLSGSTDNQTYETSYYTEFDNISAGRIWYFIFWNHVGTGKAYQVKNLSVTVYYETSDLEKPTGAISGIPSSVKVGESFTVTLEARDNKALKDMIFIVKDGKNNKHIEQSWTISGTYAKKTYTVSTMDGWELGEGRTFLVLRDQSGNTENIINYFNLVSNTGTTPPPASTLPVKACVGNNYEQQIPIQGVTLPSVSIKNTVMTVDEGKTIVLTANIVQIDSNGSPFFYWCAMQGGFEYDPNQTDHQTVRYVAPYVSKDETVKISVQLGDTLGYIDTDSITITVRNVAAQNDPTPYDTNDEPAINPTLCEYASWIDYSTTAVPSNPLNIAFDLSADSTPEYSRIYWDFGDGSTTVETNQLRVYHTYSGYGIYSGSFRVADIFGRCFTRSFELNVNKPNKLPEMPQISGPGVGFTNTAYTFKASAVDPDNDALEYLFKMIIDGQRIESGWQKSDTFTYSWSKPGSYCLKVAVRDNPLYPPVSTINCYFMNIVEQTLAGSIKILAPDPDSPFYYNLCNGVHRSDGQMKILWSDEDNDKNNDVTSIDVYYSVDYGITWNLIAQNQAADAYHWSIPGDFIHDDVRVKVVGHYNTGLVAEGVSKPFKIVDGRSATISSITTDKASYSMGEPINISWQTSCTSSSSLDRVDLRYINSGSVDSVFAQLTGDAAKSGSYTWYPAQNQITDKGQIKITVSCSNCTSADKFSQGYFAIKYNYPPGGDSAWTEAEKPFSIPDKGGSFDLPRVAVDANGGVHTIAAYSRNTFITCYESEAQIFYRKKSENGWSSQEQATSHPTTIRCDHQVLHQIENPDIATDGGGYPHVVYQYYYDANADTGPPFSGYGYVSDVYYIYRTQSGWSSPFNLSDVADTDSRNPKIAIDKNGDMYVFWYERKNPNATTQKGVYYRVKKNGGTWSVKKAVPWVTTNTPLSITTDDQNVLHLITGDADSKPNYARLQNGVLSSSNPVNSDPASVLKLYSVNNQQYITGGEGNTFYLLSRASDVWNRETFSWTESNTWIGFYLLDDGSSFKTVYMGLKDGQYFMMNRTYNGSQWSDYKVISTVPAETSDNKQDADGNSSLSAVIWIGGVSYPKQIYLSTSKVSDTAIQPVSLTHQVVSTTAPFVVNFTAASQGQMVEYQYLFGNGDTLPSTTQNSVSYTYKEAGTYIASVVATNDKGLISTASVTVILTEPKNSVIYLTPAEVSVSSVSGTAEFSIVNSGTGTMQWTAKADNSSWLRIISADSGTDEGKLIIGYDANTSTARVGTITITSPNANNSPRSVQIKQEAAAGSQVEMNWVVVAPTSSDSLSSASQWNGIGGISDNDIFAVGWGDNSKGIIWHYDGNKWTPMTVPDTAGGLYDVAGNAWNNVYAVGLKGTILHYNGTSWTQTTMPNTTFSDVWVNPDGKVFAVGSSEDSKTYKIFSYDGNGWKLAYQDSTVYQTSTMYQTNVNFFNEVWGDGKGNVFVAGANGVIVQYDGNIWRKMTTPVTQHLLGIAGLSSTDIYAAGNNEVILHYDGNEWKIMDNPKESEWYTFTNIWCASAEAIYFIDPNKETLLRYNSTTNVWTKISNKDRLTRGFFDIWGTSPDNMFAVRSYDYPRILHYYNAGNADSDSDKDGLPDSWELEYFGDLTHNADGDEDRDGLTNLQEYQKKTDPTKADTDRDGMPDKWELDHGMNPLSDDASDDPDKDGYTNAQEYLAGSDPKVVDNPPLIDRHYMPVWSNNPYNAMNLFVVSATVDGAGLVAGDEIGVFDGEKCVGAATVEKAISATDYLILKVSQDDGSGNGFTVGHSISFKIWKSGTSAEIGNANIKASFTDMGGITIAPPGFESLGTYGLTLEGFTFVTHSIPLKKGWNIVSSYVVPNPADMMTLLKPLMDDSSLVKTLDETGATIVKFSGAWTNSGIGNFSITEGYQINMTADAEWIIKGLPATLPVDIPLSQGWNIMGYPVSVPQNALKVLNPLITESSLLKVSDEAGNTVIKFLGLWQNQIGDMNPGKGYQIQVSKNTSLQIAKADTQRSRQTRRERIQRTPKHFIPVWSGNPYKRMNFWIVGIDNYGVEVGDEVGIFDGEKCVGVGVVDSEISSQNVLTISASLADDGQDGFTESHNISFRFWDVGQNLETANVMPAFFDLGDGNAIEPPVFEGYADYGLTLQVNSSVKPRVFNADQGKQTVIDVKIGNSSEMITSVSVPMHGKAEIDAGNNTILYTPEDGYSGMDIFSYAVFDGTETIHFTIRISVTPEQFTAGTFIVGDSGIVGVDWLYDGGKFVGELGIFSLTGMENLTPGSSEFIREAARRALSGSELGYVVISDQNEGARFRGTLPGESADWNSGNYKGLKKFAMKPGDTFATILVPNSTMQAAYDEPAASDTQKRPLFSLVASNADYGMHIGQLADVNGTGVAFVYEDLDFGNSDKDYNDFIFQIGGVSGNIPMLESLLDGDLPLLDTVVADGKNWTETGTGLSEKIMSHIESPPITPDTQWMAVTLSGSAELRVTDPQQQTADKTGADIPGAIIEYGANGEQTVYLTDPDTGKYSFVLTSTTAGVSTFTVRNYKGEEETRSDSKQIQMLLGEVFESDSAVSMNGDDLIFTFGSPESVSAIISADASLYGKIKPSGYVPLNPGQSQVFIITPEPACHITDVLVDGVSVGAKSEYIFDYAEGKHTIRAIFDRDVYPIITATAGEGGKIEPSGEIVVKDVVKGQTFTITPSENYHISDVLVDGRSLGKVSTYTFADVTENHTITAVFEPVVQTLKGDLNDNGVVDLKDVILCLRILSGTTPEDAKISPSADVNGDDKIGMEELVYILQKVSGLH